MDARLGFGENAMNNLLVRTFVGFAFLIVIMALALFIPAGSLSFWQGWLYLADFAVCTILITVYLIQNDRELLEGRVKAGPVAEGQKSQQIIQGLAGLCFIALFIVPGLDFRNGWSHMPAVLNWIGAALVAIGFTIVYRVFRENSYTRATIEVSAEQKVITTGPYSVVRHPMYAGAGLLVLFTPITLGSWLGIPFAILLMLVIVVRLLDEEKFLAAHLSGYTEYCKQVRYHLIPSVW
jgi:protein-S-isoprenylcysteine O-methyltransferase Ste14